MDDLLTKYADKLIQAGLAVPDGPGAPLIGGLDHTLVWNRQAPEIPVLTTVFEHLNINSLVHLRPGPPYDRIIGFLADRALKGSGRITPGDCETRTFLHDLPVADRYEVTAIVDALSRRKTVIVHSRKTEKTSPWQDGTSPGLDGTSLGPAETSPGSGGTFPGPAVIAPGTVTPEQGFVHVSSVCFACFVKFLSDYLWILKTGRTDPEMDTVYQQILPFLEESGPGPSHSPGAHLMQGPFTDETQVTAAMSQAGKQVVADRLVDSFFGNVSYCLNDILYISQTGAALDELDGCIDPVPLDGYTSAGITASSELSAHLEIITRTGCRAILHGHPRFSVILSMDCDPDRKAACEFNTRCHTHCPVSRRIGNIPIVPGEVGTGPFGLCHTLPSACETSDTVIVYGHGVFTTGDTDFVQAFSHMTAVENLCKRHYLDQVKQLTHRSQRNHLS
jgi:ribulose-5-phosphate 4-epimerase/fuculose-1-phosphate aldolase